MTKLRCAKRDADMTGLPGPRRPEIDVYSFE
jgi:hypothetical protein